MSCVADNTGHLVEVYDKGWARCSVKEICPKNQHNNGRCCVACKKYATCNTPCNKAQYWSINGTRCLYAEEYR